MLKLNGKYFLFKTIAVGSPISTNLWLAPRNGAIESVRCKGTKTIPVFAAHSTLSSSLLPNKSVTSVLKILEPIIGKTGAPFRYCTQRKEDRDKAMSNVIELLFHSAHFLSHSKEHFYHHVNLILKLLLKLVNYGSVLYVEISGAIKVVVRKRRSLIKYR